jgi:hypothetical protein
LSTRRALRLLETDRNVVGSWSGSTPTVEPADVNATFVRPIQTKRVDQNALFNSLELKRFAA